MEAVHNLLAGACPGHGAVPGLGHDLHAELAGVEPVLGVGLGVGIPGRSPQVRSIEDELVATVEQGRQGGARGDVQLASVTVAPTRASAAN